MVIESESYKVESSSSLQNQMEKPSSIANDNEVCRSFFLSLVCYLFVIVCHYFRLPYMQLLFRLSRCTFHRWRKYADTCSARDFLEDSIWGLYWSESPTGGQLFVQNIAKFLVKLNPVRRLFTFGVVYCKQCIGPLYICLIRHFGVTF